VKRLSDQTLYEIIEVPVEARPEEIERACDRAAALYGPGSLATYTLASPEETSLLCSRIEEARAVLLDPGARSRYDERLGLRLAEPVPARLAEVTAPPPPPPTWPPPEPLPLTASPRHVSPGLPAASGASTGGAGHTAGPATVAAPPLPTEGPPPTPGPQATASPPPIQLTAALQPAPQAPARPPAPILLDREAVPAPPPEIGEGSAWSGELLRRVRESRGLTLQQVSERTRVTRHHLENIEQDRFQALPAPVYLRGIIMSLARELRLDGQKVARAYLERMGAAGG
jgi:hypothetical protein